MGSLKLNIHPLFFLFGFYYALTGRIFLFIILTLTAIIHELGHSYMALRCGYRLNNIVLMPFGAVVKGDIEGLKNSDEIKIAFFGPFINLIVGVVFIAFWWIFPETYAYTDVAVYLNFTTAFVNFIPAFPLDGGRILFSIISQYKSTKLAESVCKVLGIILGGSLLGLFIYSTFIEINLSILFFSAFILTGAIRNKNYGKYVKIYCGASEKSLKRGMPIKRLAISSDTQVKRVLSLLDERVVTELVVYKNSEKLRELSQNDIAKVIETADLYSPIEEYL